MKSIGKSTFLFVLFLGIIISFILNIAFGLIQKRALTQQDYVLDLNIYYDIGSSLEFFYDTGSNFNKDQKKVIDVKKGQNSIKIPFHLKDKEQLKFLRLDFGGDTSLTQVRINKLSLINQDKTLFDLQNSQILEKITLTKGLSSQPYYGTLEINGNSKPFDPYVVFRPLNELIYPLWQRVLLIITPFLLLFFSMIIKWTKDRVELKELPLIIAAMFLIAVPLKTAWVTFTSILLLAFGLYESIRNKRIRITSNHIALFALFFIPLAMLGEGRFSKLSIPLGFVLLPLAFATLDFSKYSVSIKKIYTKVFFVLMSIIILSWVQLILFEGYFYGINLWNYFPNIKYNSHQILYWLYYDHTTFLSFFMLLGGVFCYELVKKKETSNTYVISYAFFLYAVLFLLGSRFTIGMGILLPFLLMLSTKRLSKLLLPLWIASFSGIVFFIDEIDGFRARLWKISYDGILQSPWLGQGTGNSEIVLPNTMPIQKSGIETFMRINHSHNQFLSYALENGLVGALLVVMSMVFIFFQFNSQKNKVMLLITFAILMLMIVESPFKTATPVYMISFLLSIFSFSKT